MLEFTEFVRLGAGDVLELYREHLGDGFCGS
jgi:hypothetical protein